jgi:hypothetical protein
MRADGRTVPHGRERQKVKRFLRDMLDIHGSNWMSETNAFVASMKLERRAS